MYINKQSAVPGFIVFFAIVSADLNAVTEAELEALEKQIQAQELESKKQAEGEAKRKAKAELKTRKQAEKKARLDAIANQYKDRLPFNSWLTDNKGCSIFLIDADLVKTWSADCKNGLANGRASITWRDDYGWLGVFNKDEGTLISRVEDDSPAQRAGIEVGDVIAEYNGKKVNTFSDLRKLIANTPVNSEASITIIRDGDYKTLGARISRNPYLKELPAFKGQFKDGLANGQGTQEFGNGDRYEGEWKDGVYNGRGVYYFTNGGRYDGEWKNGLANGRGIEYLTNGDRYEGEWKDSNRNGNGIFYFANGGRYDGQWKDGKANGRGSEYYPNGDRYEGEWKDGKRNGRGIFYFADGGRYEGQWKNDKYHGRGILHYKNGNRRDGEFSNGNPVKGVFYFGPGPYQGDKYEGGFNEKGQFHGEGKYTYSIGTVVRGVWENDKMIRRY